MKIAAFIVLAAASVLSTVAAAETSIFKPLVPARAAIHLVGTEHVCFCRVSETEGCEVHTSYGDGDRCECTALDANNTCRRRPCLGVFERCR